MISSLGYLSIVPVEILIEILKNLDVADWKLCLNLEAILQNLPHVYADQEAFVNDYKAGGIVEFYPATVFWIERLKIDDIVPQLKTILQVALLDQHLPNMWTPERLSIALTSIPIVRYLRTRIPNDTFYRRKHRKRGPRIWESKETVLDSCVITGNLELVVYLHECFPGGFSRTALVLAARKGAADVARFLIGLFGQKGCRVDALIEAAGGGHLEVVRALCEERKELVSVKAFVAGLRSGNVDVVKFLVEAMRLGDAEMKSLIRNLEGMHGPEMDCILGTWKLNTVKDCEGALHDPTRGIGVVERFHGTCCGMVKLSTEGMEGAAL
ncbi:hypothetical protein HDU97_005787 [Phlyctochytrium planicorne]|nr:hypothetical protein HDU97_005787 [Phlyctochytrium planicorne]